MTRLAWTGLAALLGIVAGTAVNAQSPTQDLKPALTATTSFEMTSGATGLIPPQTPFAITVRFQNDASFTPPKGLELYGWLRRISPSDLPCTDSAESFLRTGRLPIGAIFLNDPLVVTLTQENAVILTDPEFSLATANILAANTFDTRPASMHVDPYLRRVILTLPEEGRVIAVGVDGAVTEVTSGLGRPVSVVPSPDGSVFVLDETTDQITRFPQGPAPSFKAQAIIADTDNPDTAVVWGEDGVAIFDTRTGQVSQIWQGDADAVLAMTDTNQIVGLAVAQGDQLHLRYGDASVADKIVIPIAGRATDLAQSRDGRFIFAYDRAGGPVSVVDVGLSRMLQATGAGDTAISEVVVGESAAYFMLADQTRVGVLDLISLARNGVAEFREVPLGTEASVQHTEKGMLTRLTPDRSILAVHAESQQGYRLQDYAAMGNAPAMTAIALRGGTPREVVSLDRSFQEGPAGTFRTVTSLPGPGRWELVAATGLGSLSFCAEVPVADIGEADVASGRVFAVATEPPGAFFLQMEDAQGAAVRTSGTVTFVAVSGAWKDQASLETDQQGQSLWIYELPPNDPIIMTVDVLGDVSFDPLLLEPFN